VPSMSHNLFLVHMANDARSTSSEERWLSCRVYVSRTGLALSRYCPDWHGPVLLGMLYGAIQLAVLTVLARDHCCCTRMNSCKCHLALTIDKKD
jgi:hypothetical protein